MLFLASLDAVALPFMNELLDAGRLPNLCALMRQGTVLPAAPLPLVGVAYPSEYGGRRPADHGTYFPFQWSAQKQQVEYWQESRPADTIFRRVDQAERRMVAIDPPECFPQAARHGFSVSGWQFQERILLAPWTTQSETARELTRRFGAAPKTEETFGQPTANGLMAIYNALVQAPRRLQQAAEFFLEGDVPEVLWISFAGLHLASHQFFDLSLLEKGTISGEDLRRLELAVTTLLCGYDAVLGGLLERLPADSDTVVFCSKGIGPVIGWVDLLPEMLRRVLGAPPVSTPVSSLREWVPRRWRERVAGALPDSAARKLAARLWSPRADWTRTRAFTLPSDAPGFIRLNLRGRERLGIVSPADEAGLFEEIAEGLSSFTDLDGEPCIRKVVQPREIVGQGERLDAFPDMVVLWAPKRTLSGRGVRSPRFGEILRTTRAGTGRSGDHAEGAWAVVVPGRASLQPPDRSVEPYDMPATILGALGLPHQDLPGHALLRLP